METLSDIIGWCCKCRAKVPLKDPKLVTFKNDRVAYQGQCPKCLGIVTRMTKRPKVEESVASE